MPEWLLSVISGRPDVFCGGFVCFVFVWACVYMAQKMSFCMQRDDTKLSPPIDLLTHKLELSRHCSVFCVVLVWFVFFGLFLCFLFSFVFVVSCLVSWMSVTVHRTMYWSSTSLLLRPLQQRPLRELINQLIPTATCS